MWRRGQDLSHTSQQSVLNGEVQSKIWKPHIFIFSFGHCIIKYKNNLSPDQLKFINYILSKHNFQSWIFLKNEFEGYFQTKKQDLTH